MNRQDKNFKNVDGRVKQLEKIMVNFQEHLSVLFSKLDNKHQRKHSGNKGNDINSMENMIEIMIMQNLQKFDKVLQNMMNYENKVSEIDNRLKTLDTQMRETLSRGPDAFNSYQLQNKDEDHKKGEKYEQNSDNENEEQSSISSAIKQFKQNRPDMNQDYSVSPDIVKFVSMSQKGRNTACQPTIRESPHNLVVDEKMPNTSKRKGSMPNAPFYHKATRNNKKGIGSTFANRHYSTERGHIMHNRDSADRSQANNS